MDVTELSVWAQLGVVALMVVIRYLFERLISRLFKTAKIESTSVQIFTKSIVMVVFNVIILLLFGLLVVELVAFVTVGRGLTFIVIGLAGAFLVSLLSYFAVRAGYGEGYEALLAKSPTDQVLSWITFLVLVGPAEDLFFLGFVQNLLLERMGWGSIMVYVVLFTLYHYTNVLSGVEKKKEFLGTLPVRLLVATLLAVSFYVTGSLIYGFIIHSAVDTFSYAALILGARQVEQGEPQA
jgi:membrane protease YdiL (CAAX protease family)